MDNNERKARMKPVRHAIGRLSAEFDQMKAKAVDEGREDLTETEWARLRELTDRLDEAVDEVF